MILLVDGILCLVVLEAAGLLLLHRHTRRGPPPRLVLSTLAAGFCLLLTTRLALGHAPWFVLCGVLLASLCAHAADLRARW